jgi:hypothetical protein
MFKIDLTAGGRFFTSSDSLESYDNAIYFDFFDKVGVKMNENGFIQRMRADKKSQLTIKRNIEFTRIFEAYLLEKKKRKIEAATLQDLEDFRTWGDYPHIMNF